MRTGQVTCSIRSTVIYTEGQPLLDRKTNEPSLVTSFFGSMAHHLKLHYGPEQPRKQTEVLGHSLICSLALLSFAYSARLTCSAALTCLLACSFHSLPCSWDSELLDGYFVCVFSIFDHSAFVLTLLSLFDFIWLVSGTAMAYSVRDLLIQPDGGVKLVLLEGEEGKCP